MACNDVRAVSDSRVGLASDNSAHFVHDWHAALDNVVDLNTALAACDNVRDATESDVFADKHNKPLKVDSSDALTANDNEGPVNDSSAAWDASNNVSVETESRVVWLTATMHSFGLTQAPRCVSTITHVM